MDNFFEKIKDILYDGTDYLIMIVVILIVALIINWRIGGLFDKDEIQASPGNDVETVTKDPTDSKNNTKDNSNKDNKPEENSEENKGDNVSNGESNNSLVKINIPDGSLPGKIGEILESNGLVESKEAFVEKTIEMKMDTKLKSGEFEIAKGSSIEDILGILTK